MTKIWTSQTNEVHRQWWEAIINEAEERLTEWEYSFIENIGIKVDNKWTLTQAQEETLEKIYVKYTSL